MALDSIAELGARNVLISHEAGCYGLFRNRRKARRFHAAAPRVEPVSAVGSGDVLLAAFLGAQLERRPPDEALRIAVAAGAAATLEVGAGRFDPAWSSRLLADVRLDELEAVASEA
jgi:fructose-1-phosphate kinase PfkB-like protein